MPDAALHDRASVAQSRRGTARSPPALRDASTSTPQWITLFFAGDTPAPARLLHPANRCCINKGAAGGGEEKYSVQFELAADAVSRIAHSRPIFISTFVSASLHVHRRFLRLGLDALLLSLSLSPSILFPPRSHGPCTKGSKGEKRTWCQYTQGTVRGETLWDPGKKF